MRKLLGVLTGMAFFLLAGAATATPLFLESAPPDILVGFIDVQYDSPSSTFLASGFALTLDDDGVGTPLDITLGSFEIAASIDASGIASSGTLSVGGSVAGAGPALLSGELSAFGFSSSGDPLEFLFYVTGGDLAPLYGGIGSPVGVILSSTGFGGSFAGSFDNLLADLPGTGSGVADVISIIPEPTAGLLFLAGLGALAAVRSRSRT